MLAGVEKSQTLPKFHLVACGSIKMIFSSHVARVSMTICIVWCQCITWLLSPLNTSQRFQFIKKYFVSCRKKKDKYGHKWDENHDNSETRRKYADIAIAAKGAQWMKRNPDQQRMEGIWLCSVVKNYLNGNTFPERSIKVFKQPYDYGAYIAHGSNPILLFNSNLRKYDNPETNLWKLLLFASTRTQDFVMIKWRNLNDLGEK